MSLTNIKSKSQAQRGFTIVELLIVVVVIAILAAITIVSYNGITNRANQSSAKSAASNVQKKVELYASEMGNYPLAATDLTSATTDKPYALPTSSIKATAPDNSDGTKVVRIQACRNESVATNATNTASNVTGTLISYWAYGADGNNGIATIAVGQNCSTAANLQSL